MVSDIDVSVGQRLGGIVSRDDDPLTADARHILFRDALSQIFNPEEIEAITQGGIKAKNRIISKFRTHVKGNVHRLRQVVK